MVLVGDDAVLELNAEMVPADAGGAELDLPLLVGPQGEPAMPPLMPPPPPPAPPPRVIVHAAVLKTISKDKRAKLGPGTFVSVRANAVNTRETMTAVFPNDWKMRFLSGLVVDTSVPLIFRPFKLQENDVRPTTCFCPPARRTCRRPTAHRGGERRAQAGPPS